MTNRSLERMPIAIALVVFVGFLHVGALSVIGFSTGKRLVSSPQGPMFPEISSAQLFQGQLVYPQVRMSAEDRIVLRFADLKTGKYRDSEFSNTYIDRGLVTDGKTLWAICGMDSIYETDGTTVVTYRTRRKLMAGPSPWNRAFLYEGAPAIVDYDQNDFARLMVLVNRDWEDRGQIAVSSLDQVWTIDDATGRSTGVTAIPASGIRWSKIRVLPVEGEYHLLRLEATPGQPTRHQIVQISHRVGFEFVAAPGDDEPASACLPNNAPAEASGWELLTLKIDRWVGSAAVHGGQLLFAEREDANKLDENIWKQDANKDPLEPRTFQKLLSPECLKSFEYSGGEIGLVASPDTNDVYAVVHPRLGAVDVYRLDGDQFVKLPYRIDGMFAPIARQIGTFFCQIIAVFWAGTTLLVFGAAWLTNLTGQSSYSFGQESKPLASLVRRVVARAIDFMLILSPLLTHLFWRVSLTEADEIFYSLNRHLFLDWVVQIAFEPVLFWALVTWVSLIISTAYWGVTPGKWLCGIRVVQTTFRPCGFSRALVRELMLWLDAPLLLTAIPAVISWLATDYRQRISDLVADTIVVEDGRPMSELA